MGDNIILKYKQNKEQIILSQSAYRAEQDSCRQVIHRVTG